MARVRTDDLGRARVDLHPVAESYDLRAVAGDRAVWAYGIAIPQGGRRTVTMALTDAVSITGQVQALDGSGMGAIVVQALRVEELPTDPASGTGRARVAGRETGGAARPAPVDQMPLLCPLPDFSETVLSTTNGAYRFVGLRPGRYRLQAHGGDGLVSPLNGGGGYASGPAVVEVGPGRPVPQAQFRFAEPRKGTWRTIPLKRGLKEVIPSVVHRGSDGTLWAGTVEGGVFSFDGVELDDHFGSGTMRGFVSVVADGGGGLLWVGSEVGVSLFGPGTDQNFPLPPPLPRTHVSAILTDPDGQVWVGTDCGLFRQDGSRLERLGFAEGLPSLSVTSLSRTRDGALWIGTDNGLVRLEGRSMTHLRPFPGFADPRIGDRIHQSRDGALWFSSTPTARPASGVVRYDGTNFLRFGVENGLPAAAASDIAETSDGALWFVSGGGLSRFDGTTVLNYSDPGHPGDLQARRIHVDGDDVIWCATVRGIVRFDPGHFTTLDGRHGFSRGIRDPYPVGTIVPDSGGQYLVGAEGGGIFRTDGEHLGRISADTAQWDVYRKIHRSRDGTLWLGQGDGLYRFENGHKTTATGSSMVMALSSDRAGNVWFGNGWQGGGLTRYDPRNGTTRNFTSAEGMPSDEVWALEPDDSDGMWVGTGNGLARYRGGKIEVWNDPPDLQVGAVMHLRHDRDGSLWADSVIGSRSLKDGARFTSDPTNGLPRLKTFCSVRTPDGIVWMGTDGNGLLGYDGRAVTRIDTRDGLAGNQVFCAAAMTNGALLLGGMDFGLVRFQPTKSRPSIRILEARSSRLVLTNPAPVLAAEAGQSLRIRWQEIDLKTHADKRQFYYRLLDRDGTTVASAVTSQREFVWIPEKKGTFGFEVQAIDRDLNYSAPARSTLRIFLPWYGDPWVLVPSGGGVLALAGFSVYSGLRQRANRRETERLREQMLVQERSARAILEESNRALEVATQAKSLFLANMSHEIRTPLNAVLGFSQILHRDRALGPDHRRSVGIIERNALNLLSLVNGILDLSKIEAGRVELLPTDFDLRQLVLDLSAIFEPQCQQAGLAWRVEWVLAAGPGAPERPVPLHGDAGKIRQVLVNILGNAVKFTETGGVTLRVSDEADAADGAASSAAVLPRRTAFVFRVEDTGPGMPAAVREKIFDAFIQDTEGQRKGGTGLGLSIARSYIGLMGGKLQVESEPGRGSCFTVTLPLAPALAPFAPPAEGPSRLAGARTVRALVADDVPENREILRRLLSDIGISVVLCEDGALALDALRTDAYDIAFMDIRMPGLTGMEVVERYLAGGAETRTTDAGERPRTRLVAVSASALVHERELYTRKGFDAFLPKPFDFDELCRCLTGQLGVELEQPSETGPDSSPGAETAGDDGAVHSPSGPIDRARLGRLFRGDAAEIAKFLAAFLATTATQLAQLRCALDAGDFETLEILSHRSRGTSANFGITALIAPMARIEEAAIAKDLAGCREGIGQAGTAFAAVQAAV